MRSSASAPFDALCGGSRTRGALSMSWRHGGQWHAYRKNTLEAYDRFYNSDRLLGYYLSPERLEFLRGARDDLCSARPEEPHRRRLRDGTSPPLHQSIGWPLSRSASSESTTRRRASRRARELLPSATLDRCRSLRLVGRRAFDLVLCTEVLEHLHEPGRAVERLRRLCARRAVASRSLSLTVPQDHGRVTSTSGTRRRCARFLAPSGLTAIDRVEDGASVARLAFPGHSERHLVCGEPVVSSRGCGIQDSGVQIE